MRRSSLRRSAPSLLFVALLCGCSALAPGSKPEDAPTPYTPEQIRDGNPAGKELVYRIETLGAPTVLRRMRFLEADETGAVVESTTTSLHGEPIGSASKERSSWEQLRDHASYPADRTTRSEETCQVEHPRRSRGDDEAARRDRRR